jgi:two-component system, OmpR family, sensor kinase
MSRPSRTAPSDEGRFAPWLHGLLVPDEVLLRRFGYVRAVGGGAYIVAVLALLAVYGTEVWPLVIGVPVLAVVTTWYFIRSARIPRTSVAVSLVADAVVIGGVVSFLGGTGAGAVMLYAIVIVSGGILLGPAAATAATLLCGGLALLQLGLEQLGVVPQLLHRPELTDRMPILLISLFGLGSVGYLTATYASRLHELIAEAGAEAEVVRTRGRRRQTFVERTTTDVRGALTDLEAVAEILEDRWEDLRASERANLASRLRMDVMRVDAEVGQLADVGTLDVLSDTRPEPVLLARVVQDCVVALGDRLASHAVEVDVPPIKVVGNRRAARRVVYSLLENVVEHTPPGTHAVVTALTSAGNGVLVITDDGPGIPPERAAELFEHPEEAAVEGGSVGLPLVSELCEGMGARVRHETPADGGSRFLVAFRLAPSGAPTPDDAPTGG